MKIKGTEQGPFLPPRHQFNGHLQTILPAFRNITVPYVRQRINTPDGDFLDLDWLKNVGNERLVILTHGLEGDSSRPYVTSAARYFYQRNWDVIAWNCRSCSGQMNLTPKLYSHGQSEDLATVVAHADQTGRYQQIVLIGYSMGGNLTLKYLGVAAGSQPASVTHGIAFSAPCRIEHSVDALEIPGNWLYKRKFYRSLLAKIQAKAAQFPELVGAKLGGLPGGSKEKAKLQSSQGLGRKPKMPLWREFDRRYSAPLNGFATETEFYAYASAANFMAGTTVPVLLVNAINDPIIPPACTPLDLLGHHPLIHIEQPKLGGHVGFHLRGEKRFSWMEIRAAAFID